MNGLRHRFLENRFRDIAKLYEAVQQQDYTFIHTIGHRLKGTIQDYGFPEISEIGIQLMQAATAKNPAQIEQILGHLSEYITNRLQARH